MTYFVDYMFTPGSPLFPCPQEGDIDASMGTRHRAAMGLTEDTDAVVRSDNVIDSEFGEIRGTLDESLIEQVAAVPGVAGADGDVYGYAQMVDKEGKAMGNPGQGAPTLGFSWSRVPEINPMVLIEGSAPTGPGDVVIDKMSADVPAA